MWQGKGFIQPYIKPDEYIFGGRKLPDEVLSDSGGWAAPLFEPQRKGIETFNCTAFNTLTPIEMILKVKYGLDVNYSDRFTGTAAGTYPPGNNPHKVAESIRKVGLLLEEYLPFGVETLDEYYAPLPKHLLRKAKQWLAVYDFMHEWVFTPFFNPEEKRENLKKALRFSPLGVSVYAWEKNNGFYVKPRGAVDNHWTTLRGYEEGKYWEIFDSYEEEHKKLAWDYDFEFAKRYWVGRKEIQNPSWFSKLLLFKNCDIMKI
jgi:hypothetical protein